jgi:hypothetical protein
MDFPPALIAMIQKQVSEFGRVGATGVVRAPDLQAPIAVAPALSFTEQAAPLLTWNETGWVIAMYGQERTGTLAKFAQTEVRVTINGEYDLITQGQSGGAFAPLLAMFGPSVNWYSLIRRVRKNDAWQIAYRNFDPAAVCNPTLLFSMLSDAKVAAMARELSGG